MGSSNVNQTSFLLRDPCCPVLPSFRSTQAIAETGETQVYLGCRYVLFEKIMAARDMDFLG